CLAKPKDAQYRGGIIANPGFDHGLKGWVNFGGAKLEARFHSDNGYAAAVSRRRSYDSIAQTIYLHKEKRYTFSAWVQVDGEKATVRAIFKTADGQYLRAGEVGASSGCWSMLKGGFSPRSSGCSQLYFESLNNRTEIWVDNVSLQPFTEEEWRSHQSQSIEKVRKSKAKFHVVDSEGKELPGAKVMLQQKRPNFPFGAAINKNLIGNMAYQNWFAPRFTVTVFENEMKWYSTEHQRGTADYSQADALMHFAKSHNIAVRGHNVFWDDPKYQPPWVDSLSPPDLSQAADNRINSVVGRYKGQVIGWDVVNENLHFSFYESKLGPDASSKFYNKAQTLDPGTYLFLNDYNTLEDSRDPDSTPEKYLAKINQMKASPGSAGLKLAIGLEGHFSTSVDTAYIRSALDKLAQAKLPIWITELDLQSGPNQASDLEQVLREVYAHPAVNGIVMWVGWSPQGCNRMCLTDGNFKNLATGDVVDKLLREWKGAVDLEGTTDANGRLEMSVAHGEYEVTVLNPLTNVSSAHPMTVTAGTPNTMKVSA
ncbi:Endo-1-4-beta-xylanase 2, partial [Nymphaea thermarum]